MDFFKSWTRAFFFSVFIEAARSLGALENSVWNSDRSNSEPLEFNGITSVVTIYFTKKVKNGGGEKVQYLGGSPGLCNSSHKLPFRLQDKKQVAKRG